MRVATVLNRVEAVAEYTYDFGDDWMHRITVEKILPPEPDRFYPVCIDGKRHCPPGDCGGTGAFEELLQALKKPQNDNHRQRLEWMGGDFDPGAFSIEEANDRLREEFRPPAKGQRPTVH